MTLLCIMRMRSISRLWVNWRDAWVYVLSFSYGFCVQTKLVFQ